MAHPDESLPHEVSEAVAERAPRWRYAGRTNGRHVWEGPCGWCGRWAVVRARDEEVSGVRIELEMFGELECAECAEDRMHELDHIARAASEAEHARILMDAPLAGVFRGREHERAYRAWCKRRGLTPLEPQPVVLLPLPLV